MNARQNLRLHEWLLMGKLAGKIREARMVVLAYCMDERTVLLWSMDIVEGRMAKENALVFMERVLAFVTEESRETPFLS